MKWQLVARSWVVFFGIFGFYATAAPVEGETGKNEFVFLLPRASGDANLYNAAFTYGLLPPLEDEFQNAKDSYGNPITTPALGEADGKKIVNAAGLQFEIPSYASGITDIRKPTDELLPPLTSGEVPEGVYNIPEVQQPSVELQPPLRSDDISIPKDTSLNEITGRISSDAVTETLPKLSPEVSPPEEEKVDSTKYEGEKYTGGFRGPSGILGEQKEAGHAIKAAAEFKDTEVSPQKNINENSITPEAKQHTSPELAHTTEAQIPAVEGHSTPVPIIHATVPSVSLNSETEEKGNALPTPIPSSLTTSSKAESTSALFLAPPFPFNSATPTISAVKEEKSVDSLAQRFGFEKPPSDQELAHPQTTFRSNIPASGSGAFPLANSPFFTQSATSFKDKYTGGFGGAPGVLGSQGKPGFAVQPDGSIKDPDHTYRPPPGNSAAVVKPPPPPSPPTPAAPSHHPITTKYEKYTGGFGGPPGILVPFDNKKSR